MRGDHCPSIFRAHFCLIFEILSIFDRNQERHNLMTLIVIQTYQLLLEGLYAHRLSLFAPDEIARRF